MNTEAERLAKNLNIKAGMISMDEAAALLRKLAAENEAIKQGEKQ